MKNENQPSGDDIQVIGTIEQSMHNLYSYIMQFKFCKAQYLNRVAGRSRNMGGGKGSSLYYVRVFWGFFQPPTHLRKDISTT